MGKGEDLWDDSALINAFNDAVSKYKIMHSKGAKHSSNEENLAALDGGSNELKSNGEGDDNSKVAPDTTIEMGDASYLPSVKENSSSEAVPPESQVNAQNTQDKAIESICSQSVEDYNQLLNTYYKLEDQRQKILQQLNQFGMWSYRNSASTSQEHQAYAAQSSHPTESSFYCPHGCQSWVSPCTASPCCLGGNQDDKPCDASVQGVQQNNSSLQNSNLVNIAKEAAEKVLSSLKQASNTASLDSFANEGKQIEMNPVTAEKAAGLETDLTEVLNAWYSAGLYTGKYLSEQSYSKKSRG
ncbi:uncharacterized protein [Nicotiana sylvestris]|uniref:Uncharacterized protein LOC104217640 isoform X1 n=2 Tax=Nicotiana sylvestris TaxID=4096 RepID=A0A1U7VIS4_NICSY|nr:PREDICTED: uncharacterized protein LOC104217640 isoform X1 [Nicotiana sylvestris]